MSINNEALTYLKTVIQGEVLNDKLSLGIYSTDASIYKIDPKLVIIPKNTHDVLETIKTAFKHKISLLPRGAGTSLDGQTVGDSIVLDFSKYMNKILEFNKEEKWIRVEPGLVHSELNDFLKPHGLFFAPDEATINRANVGGVVINNSSGARSLIWGKAIDHVLEAKIILATGEVLTLGPISKEDASIKAQQNNSEGHIYKTFIDIIENDENEIKERFPKVMRRVSGYPLDEYIDGKAWNMAKILCGSEGSLATLIEVKLNLVDLPKKRTISVVHYDDRLEAIKSVVKILEHKPSAVEIMDENVISIAKTNPSTIHISDFIVKEPKAILIVEFIDEDYETLLGRHQKLGEELKNNSSVYAIPFFRSDEKSFDNVWEVRKFGLGLLLSIKTEAKPIPFIEDSCIPVEHLHQYIKEIIEFCDELNVEVVLYAHASVGVIHIRPILNLRLQDDIYKMEKISHFTLEKTIEYKGSFSGEHGDGLSRSYGIPVYFGEKIYEDFRKLKYAFDPGGLMNPGKLVDAGYLTENLRYGSEYKEIEVPTIYHYRKEEGFSTLVNMCNGVGVCHRVSGGVMCPTYKATMDESASTRGRANAIRLTISGELGEGDLTNKELLDVLDLCVSCKSCKTECPSNVDVAKLKSEITQKKYDKHGYGLREFFILYSDLLSRYISGPFAGIVNSIQKTIIFRKSLEKIAGIDSRRILPSYASENLDIWYKNNFKPKATGREVVLFSDTYTNYHEPEIGKSVIKLLDDLNYKVTFINTGDSKRPLISNGFLKKAKKYGEKIADKLLPYLERKIPVLVIEPGSFSALYDDIPDLIDDENKAQMLKENVKSIEVFLANAIKSGEINKKFSSTLSHHIIHGHCHQKAIDSMEPLETLLRNTEGTFEIFDAGCCGMAGAFGYEKEHFDLSKKIYENELGAKISALPKDAIILATGFSCRHQIRDMSGRTVKHWAEVIGV
ncbi:MAG: FAD-binding protein [Saprospiraceae bacterium]|nr:FAD-binding protein [Saprospiraceae bacterium]